MISIVVPCYNTEKTIARTVDGLLRQSYEDYQIILVDDGSEDNTSHICDKYADNDQRVKAIHQLNTGLMGAWKRGVLESDGEYIGFCDSDDYLDDDYIRRVSDTIEEYQPDLIAFGLVSEYSDGTSTRIINKLPEGYYEEKAIKNTIFPKLLSDGGMQSEFLIKSRWTKVFRKSTLLSIMEELNENVSIGEDQLALFAVMQVVRSLYCMGDYCPYHYIRTSDSMIGRFDECIFDKTDLLYKEMQNIARSHGYVYNEQIMNDRLSTTLLHVKKYICRSRMGYWSTRGQLQKVRKSQEFIQCIRGVSIDKYDVPSKIFAILFILKMYLPLYYLTRLAGRLRGQDV